MATVTLKERKKMWDDMKKKHPDATLLFRNGDFCQVYGDDAVKVSQILDLKLEDVEYLEKNCAFPHHALDTYLPRLIRAGLRVAICDDLEAPQKAKKNVTAEQEIAQDDHTKEVTEKELDIDAAMAKLSDAVSKLSEQATTTLNLLHNEYERSRKEYEKNGASYITMTNMANATKWLSVVARVQYDADKCLGDIDNYWC